MTIDPRAISASLPQLFRDSLPALQERRECRRIRDQANITVRGMRRDGAALVA